MFRVNTHGMRGHAREAPGLRFRRKRCKRQLWLRGGFGNKPWRWSSGTRSVGDAVFGCGQ